MGQAEVIQWLMKQPVGKEFTIKDIAKGMNGNEHNIRRHVNRLCASGFLYRHETDTIFPSYKYWLIARHR